MKTIAKGLMVLGWLWTFAGGALGGTGDAEITSLLRDRVEKVPPRRFRGER